MHWMILSKPRKTTGRTRDGREVHVCGVLNTVEMDSVRCKEGGQDCSG